MTFCHISAHVQAKTLIKKPVRLHERCKALIESKQMLGLVHLTAEKFDNEASFLQFTLIFHENRAFRKRTSHPRTVYTNPQSRQRNLSGIPFQGVLVEFECGQKMVWKLSFFFKKKRRHHKNQCHANMWFRCQRFPHQTQIQNECWLLRLKISSIIKKNK